MTSLIQKLAEKIEENAGKRLHSEYQAKQYVQIMVDYISENSDDSQLKE